MKAVDLAVTESMVRFAGSFSFPYDKRRQEQQGGECAQHAKARYLRRRETPSARGTRVKRPGASPGAHGCHEFVLHRRLLLVRCAAARVARDTNSVARRRVAPHPIPVAWSGSLIVSFLRPGGAAAPARAAQRRSFTRKGRARRGGANASGAGHAPRPVRPVEDRPPGSGRKVGKGRFGPGSDPARCGLARLGGHRSLGPPCTAAPRTRRRHGWVRSHSHRRLETRDPRPGRTVLDGLRESDHHLKRLSTDC